MAALTRTQTNKQAGHSSPLFGFLVPSRSALSCAPLAWNSWLMAEEVDRPRFSLPPFGSVPFVSSLTYARASACVRKKVFAVIVRSPNLVFPLLLRRLWSPVLPWPYRSFPDLRGLSRRRGGSSFLGSCEKGRRGFVSFYLRRPSCATGCRILPSLLSGVALCRLDGSSANTARHLLFVHPAVRGVVCERRCSHVELPALRK